MKKSAETQELEQLRDVEERIRRTQRRERCCKVAIAGLGLLLTASIAAHFGRCKKHKKSIF